MKTEDLQRSDTDDEFPHGKEIFQRLPQYLYHATPKKTLAKVTNRGYLGFNYREHSSLDAREWQKSGWGVFFGTNPEACTEYMSSNVDRDQEIVYLKVNKNKLDPEKFYVDDDIMQGYEDFDDADVDDISVFYADKVPFSYIEFVSKEDKPDLGPNSRAAKTKEFSISKEEVERKIQQCFSQPLSFQHPTEKARRNLHPSCIRVLHNFTLLDGTVKCRGFVVEFKDHTRCYEIRAYLPSKLTDPTNSFEYDRYEKALKELETIFKPFCNSVKKARVYISPYSSMKSDGIDFGLATAT